MNISKRLVLTVIAAWVVLSASSVFGQGKGESTNLSITGSWYVTSTPAGGPPPFKALITFSEGGGLIASAQGDILLNIGSLATAGHGTWVRTGNGEFLFTFRQIFYTADGDHDGGLKVRHRAKLNKAGTEWSGELTFDILAPNGDVVFSDSGSGTATRIVAEPL